MGVYHTMAAHFPVALWLMAFLVILYRVFSNSTWARTTASTLGVLLFAGALTGAITFILGLTVWTFDATIYSPAGRNHLLMSAWTLILWIVIWILYYRFGADLWRRSRRWLLLGLGVLGASFVTITGAVGGKLAGNPSGVSKLFRPLGWDMDNTFYLPNAMLIVVILSSAVIIALAVLKHSKAKT